MKSDRYAARHRPARDLAHERSGGLCEVALTDVCLGAVGSLQHREAYRMGGRKDGHADSAAELLAVCGDGTRGCHGHIEGHPTQAGVSGWIAPRGRSTTTRVLYRGWWVYLTASGRILPARAPRDDSAPVRCSSLHGG